MKFTPKHFDRLIHAHNNVYLCYREMGVQFSTLMNFKRHSIGFSLTRVFFYI